MIALNRGNGRKVTEATGCVEPGGMNWPGVGGTGTVSAPRTLPPAPALTRRYNCVRVLDTLVASA